MFVFAYMNIYENECVHIHIKYNTYIKVPFLWDVCYGVATMPGKKKKGGGGWGGDKRVDEEMEMGVS